MIEESKRALGVFDGMPGITVHRSLHYQVVDLGKTSEECWTALRNIFAGGGPDEMNLLMGSTDGVHGHSTTLDDIRDGVLEELLEHEVEPRFTVLVIHPRLCCLKVGNVLVETDEQMEWLRDMIRRSVTAFAASQLGNT